MGLADGRVDSADGREAAHQLRVALQRGPRRQREAADAARERPGAVRRVRGDGEYGLAGGHEIAEQAGDARAAQVARGAQRLAHERPRGEVAVKLARQSGAKLRLSEKVD